MAFKAPSNSSEFHLEGSRVERAAVADPHEQLPQLGTQHRAHIFVPNTKNRLMVAFDSNKGPNLKVVKWC